MRRVIGLVLGGGLLVGAPLGWAARESIDPRAFDPKMLYSVTYQVSQNESKTLNAVNVLDVIMLRSRPFLFVRFKGFGDKNAYLDLESVRAIIQQ